MTEPGFFQYIRHNYNLQTTQYLKKSSKIEQKLNHLFNQKIFLLKCRDNCLIPKFLRFNLKFVNIKHEKEKFNKITNNYKKQIINLAIKEVFITENIIIKERNHIWKFLNTKLLKSDLLFFKNSQQPKLLKQFNKIKNNNIKKISKLLAEKYELEKIELKNLSKEKNIKNLTNNIIPENVKIILNLGPNFGYTYKKSKIPIIKTISSIEATINNLPNAEKIRSEIVHTTQNFINKYQTTEKIFNKSLLKKYIDETQQFLKNNKEILILKADKINTTVIMDRKEYDNQIETLLNDENIYTKLKKDPTNQIQTKLNNIISNIHKKGKIDWKLSKFLKSYNGIAPAIYGLPKIHKINTPLRPIVSCIQSVTYNFSKFLESFITPTLGKSNFHIKDSWEFAEFIKNITIPENYILISLDVKSLYTNVTLDLIEPAIKNRWIDISKNTNLDFDTFLNVIKFVINELYFRFNEKFYKQISGLPMGLPLSAPLANLVMEELENLIIPKLPFNIPFYKRYVDDIITAIPKNQIQQTLKIFNTYHPRLQFTIEIETKSCISFLDILLIRNNNQIKIKWYRKKIASERFLNFKGINPISHKRNVITALIDRAIAFTNPNYRPDSINTIKNILNKNNYPKKFYQPIINNRINKYYNNNKNNNNNTELKKFISIPYISGLSEQINRILKKYNFKIAYKSNNIFKKFYSKLKYNIDKKK